MYAWSVVALLGLMALYMGAFYATSAMPIGFTVGPGPRQHSEYDYGVIPRKIARPFFAPAVWIDDWIDARRHRDKMDEE
jgi:hypothetical protein